MSTFNCLSASCDGLVSDPFNRSSRPQLNLLYCSNSNLVQHKKNINNFENENKQDEFKSESLNSPKKPSSRKNSQNSDSPSSNQRRKDSTDSNDGFRMLGLSKSVSCLNLNEKINETIELFPYKEDNLKRNVNSEEEKKEFFSAGLPLLKKSFSEASDLSQIENRSANLRRPTFFNARKSFVKERNVSDDLRVILEGMGKICTEDVKIKIENSINDKKELMKKFYDVIFDLVFSCEKRVSIQGYAGLIHHLIVKEEKKIHEYYSKKRMENISKNINDRDNNHINSPLRSSLKNKPIETTPFKVKNPESPTLEQRIKIEKKINEQRQCLFRKLQDIFESKNIFDINKPNIKGNFIWFLKQLILLKVLGKRNISNCIAMLISNFFMNQIVNSGEICKNNLEFMTHLISLMFTKSGVSNISNELFESMSKDKFSVYEFHYLKSTKENIIHNFSKDILKLLNGIRDICHMDVVIKEIFTVTNDYLITLEDCNHLQKKEKIENKEKGE